MRSGGVRALIVWVRFITYFITRRIIREWNAAAFAFVSILCGKYWRGLRGKKNMTAIVGIFNFYYVSCYIKKNVSLYKKYILIGMFVDFYSICQSIYSENGCDRSIQENTFMCWLASKGVMLNGLIISLLFRLFFQKYKNCLFLMMRLLHSWPNPSLVKNSAEGNHWHWD